MTRLIRDIKQQERDDVLDEMDAILAEYTNGLALGGEVYIISDLRKRFSAMKSSPPKKD